MATDPTSERPTSAAAPSGRGAAALVRVGALAPLMLALLLATFDSAVVAAADRIAAAANRHVRMMLAQPAGAVTPPPPDRRDGRFADLRSGL